MVAGLIPTKVHGIVDYATSGALVAAPDVLRLKQVRSSALIPRIVGATSGVYSALTDYELGAVRALPVKTHLALDAASGTLLAVSPWALGNWRHGIRHWLPHTAIGVGEVAIALMTKTEHGDPEGGTMGRLRKGALGALVIAAGAGGAALWRRRSRGGFGTAGGEAFSSVGMASAGEPRS
jgi:hypothetical protein